MKHKIKNILVEFELVKNKLEIAQQLVTHDGFYKFWFEQLALPENRNKSKSGIFDEVNELYQEIFKTNVGRYSSYNSFQNIVRKNRKG